MKKKALVYCFLVFLLLVSSAMPFQASAFARAANDGVVILRVPEDRATLIAAIDDIPDGGVIDIAAGTYASPDGGFLIRDLQKGFTVRARAGATVVLDGGGSRNVVRFENTSQVPGGAVVFEGITFANGYIASDSVAGGVSVVRADATFINCTFRNNHAEQMGVGGGVLVHQAVAFFFDSTWQDNASANYGGGMAISDNSKVYIHNSRFYNNRTNLPGHSLYSSGGGIHVLNSTLRVSNTRFENNQTGAFGAGLYILAPWSAPFSTPHADVIVVNSTFINNQAVPDASVTLPAPTAGGGVNVEGQAILKIYHSRFLTNKANLGGGINNYRSKLEVYDSVFQGNQAQISSLGSFGGAIAATALDTSDDGNVNIPTGYTTVEDTLFQGRYGNVTTVGPSGGCIAGTGDSTRIDGDPTIPDMGNVADNRITITLRRVVLNDCDVQHIATSSAAGGGINFALTHLTMDNSIVMNSDALGNGTSGGGVVLVYNSLANVTNSTFVKNSATQYGAALFVQGSTLNLSGSSLIENTLSTQYGAGIFAAPDDARKIAVSGMVQNNVFSNNAGQYHIFDDDRTAGPFNVLVYQNNQFYQSSGTSTDVYKTSYPAACFPNACTVTELNNLTLKHGSTTSDKGSGNVALASIPSVGKMLAVPLSLLSTAAPGETVPTVAYLGYAWSGGTATLDNSNLSSHAGVVASGAGNHTLSVGKDTFDASIGQPVMLAAAFSATGSPVAATLSWNLTTGTFLDAAIDRGAPSLSAASGSVNVSNSTETTYRLLIITQEGGVVKTLATGSPLLLVPASITVLAGLNFPVNRAYIPVQNGGDGTMSWAATGQTPDLLTVDTPGGQTQTYDSVVLTLRVSKVGNYTGYVKIDAGSAGSQTVQVNVIVVNNLEQNFLPVIPR